MPAKKRLIIDLDPEQHARIKQAAAGQGKTMRGYVLEKLDVPRETVAVDRAQKMKELFEAVQNTPELRGISQLMERNRAEFRENFFRY